MNNKILISSLVLLLSLNLFAQSDRALINHNDTWDLSHLYQSNDEFRNDINRAKDQIHSIKKHKGSLGHSADSLLACLKSVTQAEETLIRLAVYANLQYDQDIRVLSNQALQQETDQLFTLFSDAVAFLDPEIISIGEKTIQQFIQNKKELKDYDMQLQDIFRSQNHSLSENEESLIAKSTPLLNIAYDTYSTFNYSEMPWQQVTLSDSSTVTVNQANYGKYRGTTNRNDRELIFHSFWSSYSKFKATYGQLLYGVLQGHIYISKARNYSSSLESALDRNNIPTSVYHSLIDNVNKSLPTFHRYLKLKKRMLDVDTLKYSDMYASSVKDVSLSYTYDEAQKIIVNALKPLGENYTATIKKAFSNRWIDVYPTTGKRGGAYSSGDVYNSHPYILLNYNGLYDDMSTLAHELGHTMHSYYSNTHQPVTKAQYPIFVAEVASTFNEALLANSLLDTLTDKNERLALLMRILDGFKGTYFRQTQFAEFELRIHEEAEKGNSINAETLTNWYKEILVKYYGSNQNICQIDDLVIHEWAYVPHFYYNFYVYQYATSYTASMALAEKVIAKEKGAIENYIGFISSGGSKYPIETLKLAGVDLTTQEPFEKAMIRMNKIMDEIESLLE